MFIELAPVLTDDATLLISVARADAENLRLTITPRTPKAQDAPAEGALRLIDKPIVITATPAELDADLAGHLTSYVARRAGLATAFEALDTELEAERKAASSRIAAEKSKGQKTSATGAAALPAKLAAEPTLL